MNSTKIQTDFIEKYEIKNAVINEDMSISCNSDVDLSNKDISYLPVQFKEVNGDFDISNNNLISMTNFPNVIKGSFNCSNNQIVNAKEFPILIGKNVDCSNNLIMSINIMQQEFNGSINLSFNNINRVCIDILSCLSLDLQYNSINEIIELPRFIHNSLNISNNYITNLCNMPEKIGHNLVVKNNPLKNYDSCFVDIGGFYISNVYNGIIDIEDYFRKNKSANEELLRIKKEARLLKKIDELTLDELRLFIDEVRSKVDDK